MERKPRKARKKAVRLEEEDLGSWRGGEDAVESGDAVGEGVEEDGRDDDPDRDVKLTLSSVGSGLLLLGSVLGVTFLVFTLLGGSGGGGWEESWYVPSRGMNVLLLLSMALLFVGAVMALLGRYLQKKKDGPLDTVHEN